MIKTKHQAFIPFGPFVFKTIKVLNTNALVLVVTQFILNMTEVVVNKIGFVANITRFLLNMKS